MDVIRPNRKRSVVIDDRKTSISLEDPFWEGLKEIAVSHKATLQDLVGVIHAANVGPNLSSAIRVFVLHYFVEAAARSSKKAA